MLTFEEKFDIFQQLKKYYKQSLETIEYNEKGEPVEIDTKEFKEKYFSLCKEKGLNEIIHSEMLNYLVVVHNQLEIITKYHKILGEYLKNINKPNEQLIYLTVKDEKSEPLTINIKNEHLIKMLLKQVLTAKNNIKKVFNVKFNEFYYNTVYDNDNYRALLVFNEQSKEYEGKLVNIDDLVYFPIKDIKKLDEIKDEFTKCIFEYEKAKEEMIDKIGKKTIEILNELNN